MGDIFWGEIEEIPDNICGVIDYGEVAYYITSLIDDPVEREFTIHTVFDLKAPDTLIYGENGDQQDERDPEWVGRPCCIVEYEATMLYALYGLSPTGVIPLDIVLQIGLGCVRALAALHRLGYVHRQVSPFTFAFPNPINYDNFEAKMLIIDFSLALPWPCRPRVHVPFVGTLRYSSVRAHKGREQGPSDDIISVIYMMAEMISGKLPWRSIFDEKRVCDAKCEFFISNEFKRLPREIRAVYRTMYLTRSPLSIDYKKIIEQFKAARARRFPDDKRELPHWLCAPLDE